MRPRPSRPMQTPDGGATQGSQGMSASLVDAGREEVSSQLGLTRQAVRIPVAGDQAMERRPGELIDAAQQEVLQIQDSLVAARAHARAHAAADAAARIADGTYGICQACGRPIPPRRLQADPLTLFCLPCQDAREQGSRDRYRLDKRGG